MRRTSAPQRRFADRIRGHVCRVLAALLLTPLVAVLLPLHASATITQKFKTTEPMVPGSLVSLATKPETVAPAEPSNVASLYGIAVSVDGNYAQVATSEVVPTLIDTDGGDVAPNDPITVSFLKGIGTKATTSTRVVGFAQDACSAKAKGAKTTTVKDSKGKEHTVAICVLPVLVGAAYYSPIGSPASGNNPDSFLPAGLQHVFDTIAGHQVVPSKVVLSLFLLLVVVVIIGILAGTSIHSSLVAIGRNPLAKGQVLKGLIQVGVATVGLIAGALFGVYFIVSH